MADATESRTVFTLEAVNALLPTLQPLVAAQMDRRGAIDERVAELGKLLGTSSPPLALADDDASPVRDLKRDLQTRIARYQQAWREVEATGAVLKDPRMGLLDFYGRVDGKLVWLCWRFGEEAVTHFHALDEGFGGRKPIESTMRRRHLN
ncbi:MAG TPA: DUF2203 domain-containing protein [Polyangiaceae bacterium]|jgi:hypothetical protein|nr:DUF2203 domain-containing protein [Polyangiaceae bacterium]